MPSAPRRVGLAVFAAGLSTTLPLPLYAEYAAGAGTGPLAAAFAAYALVLILGAPLLGPLPDRLGRRPVMLAGLVLTGGSTLLLALWPGLVPLALARVLQGVGMGCVSNAAGAWAAELATRDGQDTDAASRTGAAMVTAGTAGAFGAGSLLTLLNLLVLPEARPPLVFWGHLVLVALTLAAVAALPETWGRRPGRWLRWPAFPRGGRLGAAVMLPAWGTTGVMLTAMPAALAVAGQPMLGPWAVAFMILMGTASQRLIQGLAPARGLRLGLPVLALGCAAAMAGTLMASVPLLLLGGAGIGVAAYGLLYQGGLALALAAAPQERPRAAAGFFVVAHAGFSLVPLATGVAADAWGAAPALGLFWAAVAGACLVLWLLLARRP